MEEHREEFKIMEKMRETLDAEAKALLGKGLSDVLGMGWSAVTGDKSGMVKGVADSAKNVEAAVIIDIK